MSDLKKEILEYEDSVIEAVEVPEWPGVRLYIKNMSAAERESWEQTLVPDDEGNTEILGSRARLLVRCICDETGERIFTDPDADALNQKNSKAIDRLWAVADRINTVTDSEARAEGN